MRKSQAGLLFAFMATAGLQHPGFTQPNDTPPAVYGPVVPAKCTPFVAVPCGLAVPSLSKLYAVDPGGGVSEIDLFTGTQSWQSKDYALPIAFAGGNLYLIRTTTSGATVNHQIFGVNVNENHKVVLQSQTLPLPSNLQLPSDDYETRFRLVASCENGTLAVMWRLTKTDSPVKPLQQLLHLSVDAPEQNGAFIVNLENGAVQNVAFDKTLWQNLCDLREKQIKPANACITSTLEPEAVEYASVDGMLIYMTRTYPPQPTLGSAGVVIKRQLKGRDEKSEHQSWEHELPAIFVPAARTF
jgi:hypothetical protein